MGCCAGLQPESARDGELEKDLYEWLLKWFNLAPEIADGDPDKVGGIALSRDERSSLWLRTCRTSHLTMPKSEMCIGHLGGSMICLTASSRFRVA